MEKFVTCVLIGLFVIVYFKVIELFVWQYLPINSGAGVLGFSFLFLIICFVLAMVTVKRIVDMFEN